MISLITTQMRDTVKRDPEKSSSEKSSITVSLGVTVSVRLLRVHRAI